MNNAGWIDPQTIVPLVDTRLQAIVRRGRSGLNAEWDGTLLLAALGNEKLNHDAAHSYASGVWRRRSDSACASGIRTPPRNDRRLTEEYQVRVDTVVAVIKEDLQRESADISVRLASLKTAL